jgi:hypothetical protein
MSKYGLDKFYTKPDIVEWCLSHVNILSYDWIIEPSVGNGAFYNKIIHPNKLGIDISPQIFNKNIITSDFLAWEPNVFPIPPHILFIGNPPFGRNGSLALKFIKKISKYKADIAFILPRGFKKNSMYEKIPLNYHKVLEKDLPHNSFLYNNVDYHVPCVFQVYAFSKQMRSKKDITLPKYFTFVDKQTANLSVRRVGVNAGNVFTSTDVSETSHYFIKTDYADVILKKINKNSFSSNDTTGPRSIPKPELIEVIDSNIEMWLNTSDASEFFEF